MEASAFTVGCFYPFLPYASCWLDLLWGSSRIESVGNQFLVISQIGTLAGYILLALSNKLWLIFVARIIDGVTAGNISVAHAYVSDNTPREQRNQSLRMPGTACSRGALSCRAPRRCWVERD